MGWTTPPTFSSGGIASSAYLNDISQDLVVLENSLGFLGDTTPVHLLLCGPAGVETNGSGVASITFGQTFPNVPPTVLYSNSNNAGNYTFYAHYNAVTQTGLGITVLTASTGATADSTNVVISYIAIGS